MNPNNFIDDQNFLLAQIDDLPNNQTMIWPLNADAKIAIGATLKSVLKAIGFVGDKYIPVIFMGSFHKALLNVYDKTQDETAGKTDPTKWTFIRSQPVIVVGRDTDVANRMGIGENIGVFPVTAMVDPTGILAALKAGPETEVAATEATVYGEYSNATIGINIFDTNPRRVERIYGIIKILMIQIQVALMKQCGFLEITRIDGGDGQDITTDNPTGISIVAERHLTYRVIYPEIVVMAPQLIQLALLRFTAEFDGVEDENATITVDL
jgi:hypothetical protein